MYFDEDSVPEYAVKAEGFVQEMNLAFKGYHHLGGAFFVDPMHVKELGGIENVAQFRYKADAGRETARTPQTAWIFPLWR